MISAIASQGDNYLKFCATTSWIYFIYQAYKRNEARKNIVLLHAIWSDLQTTESESIE